MTYKNNEKYGYKSENGTFYKDSDNNESHNLPDANKDRVILHSDLNNFFASVETALNPSLKGKAIAVCGSVENRHGIVLAKSELAKSYGVKTTMTVGEAKRLCPELVIVGSHYKEYCEYSKKVREIYSRFTDLQEPFGIDESWLDVTASGRLGSGEQIADEIRRLVKTELNLTCSVGVSFNKVFAKLGSDLKKPDGTTVITRENFKQKVWRLPVENLLYVGKATLNGLTKYNIKTIGELANAPYDFLIAKFGKGGETLYKYANGLDDSPVSRADEVRIPDSVGNSVTLYRDLKSNEEVKQVLASLCEKVSSRLLKSGAGEATVLAVNVRDGNLKWFSRQEKLPYPTVLYEDFLKSAYSLFVRNYDWKTNVRSIGVTVSGFEKGAEQVSFFKPDGRYEKKVLLENTVGKIREKYGSAGIKRGITMVDESIIPKTRDDEEEEN